MKIGSLFDGSGGFPLAATMCGIRPAWAAEVEPYPIAVTKSRFPSMKHLGDVSKINGEEIEPVDVISFGSPCQDMSIAGKRVGIKHKENGDEETSRSGLFMEAARIIKEMRRKTCGIYPTFAIWENVPGAFSSNKGEDFRLVLETLIRISEPEAAMPPVPKGGWPRADCYCGDGWSIAYRTFDAQYWGVPQRRRRIYLVMDFGGERAGKILFEREGLRGNFETGRAEGKRTSGDAERGSATGDGNCLTPWDSQNRRVFLGDGVFPTLQSREKSGQCQQTVLIAAGFKANQGSKAGGVGWQEEKSCALNASNPGLEPTVCIVCDARGNGDGKTAGVITGDHESRVTDYTNIICIQGNTIDRKAKQNGSGVNENMSFALNSTDRHGVAFGVKEFGKYKEEQISGTLKARDYKGSADIVVGYKTRYIVRRLTPVECARLQGFPDKWGIPKILENMTDEEFNFWQSVRRTLAEIKGRKYTPVKRDTLLRWYNNLHTDSAEYKMWGNGIAFPTALYVMQGVSDALKSQFTGG